jgi:hypothetical protein
MNHTLSSLVETSPVDTPFDDLIKAAYHPRYAAQAEKLRLLGATLEELRRWFNVHEIVLDVWTKTYDGFARALRAKPAALNVVDDFSHINWLKDLRLGRL